MTLVYPGAIGTNIAANSGIEINHNTNNGKNSIRPLAADKAAQIIVDAIEQDRYSVLVGSDAKLMDFIYRFNPKAATGFICKQMRALLPA